MDPHIIELATQIATDASQIRWLVVGLVVAIAAVGLYLHARISGFGVRLGQIEAETSKIETIKANLRATTEVAENIKSEIGQKDWRERERLVFMRGNLEKLVRLAYEVMEELDQSIASWPEDHQRGDYHVPSKKLQALARMYFPGLLGVADDLVSKASDAFSITLKLRAPYRVWVLAVLADAEATMPNAKADVDEAKEAHIPALHVTYIACGARLDLLCEQAVAELKKYML